MMEATLLMFSVLFVHLYLHHVDLLKFATFVYNLWEEVELGISFFFPFVYLYLHFVDSI